jgi:hypothetical protein
VRRGKPRHSHRAARPAQAQRRSRGRHPQSPYRRVVRHEVIARSACRPRPSGTTPRVPGTSRRRTRAASSATASPSFSSSVSGQEPSSFCSGSYHKTSIPRRTATLSTQILSSSGGPTRSRQSAANHHSCRSLASGSTTTANSHASRLLDGRALHTKWVWPISEAASTGEPASSVSWPAELPTRTCSSNSNSGGCGVPATPPA